VLDNFVYACRLYQQALSMLIQIKQKIPKTDFLQNSLDFMTPEKSKTFVSGRFDSEQKEIFDKNLARDDFH
jgi:hypothetical protein